MIEHNYDQIYSETSIQEQLQHGLVTCCAARHICMLFPHYLILPGGEGGAANFVGNERPSS